MKVSTLNTILNFMEIASKDETRGAMQSVLLEVVGVNKIKLVSTNGYSLAISKEIEDNSILGEKGNSVIISRDEIDTLKVLSKKMLISSVINKNHMKFSNGVEIVGIDREYPNYKPLTPKPIQEENLIEISFDLKLLDQLNKVMGKRKVNRITLLVNKETNNQIIQIKGDVETEIETLILATLRK